MKSSIKLKLFTAISCLTLLYVLLSWFLNDQFLAKYYYLNKESTLKEYYHEINENYDGEPFDILLNLEKIERTEGLNITILDSSMYIKYISSLKEEEFFMSHSKSLEARIIRLFLILPSLKMPRIPRSL
ncbi:hypothetical protein [Dehalobacter restrictus]|uniref:hypothetical protein n=1 Tax=Dehalobacter restrictus TaxID=55583 RepID=UPI0005717F74|nr:hypothetical protein [Dehalobacter restrictus]